MAKIILRIIIPKSMNILQYERKLRAVVKEETGIVERMYMRVSRGFSSPQPTYKKTVRLIRGDLRGTTSTDEKRMVYLDKGTNTRWAVMSQDFRPRTTPRTLGIKQTRGRTVIRGRKAMTARNIAPRPGIKPRHYTDEIAKRRKPWFEKKMQRAIGQAARETF